MRRARNGASGAGKRFRPDQPLIVISDCFGSIAASGSSSYTLNNKDITFKLYNAQLEKFNILTKAKNFLVFQGDVEGLAIQDGEALAKLIDRISG